MFFRVLAALQALLGLIMAFSFWPEAGRSVFGPVEVNDVMKLRSIAIGIAGVVGGAITLASGELLVYLHQIRDAARYLGESTYRRQLSD